MIAAVSDFPVFGFRFTGNVSSPAEMYDDLKSIVIDHQRVYSLVYSATLRNRRDLFEQGTDARLSERFFAFQTYAIVLRHRTANHSDSRIRVLVFVNYVRVRRRNGKCLNVPRPRLVQLRRTVFRSCTRNGRSLWSK